jgi:hypothetical protein
MEEKQGYTIDVRITHREWLVSRIGAAMDCDPDVSWSVGDERALCPSGSPVGCRSETYWCLGRQSEGERSFFGEFREVCEWLTTKKSFLSELQATGGRAAVTIGLRGSANIGDTLVPDDFRLAAELGIDLSIEVFPQMNPLEEGESRMQWAPWRGTGTETRR